MKTIFIFCFARQKQGSDKSTIENLDLSFGHQCHRRCVFVREVKWPKSVSGRDTKQFFLHDHLRMLPYSLLKIIAKYLWKLPGFKHTILTKQNFLLNDHYLWRFKAKWGTGWNVCKPKFTGPSIKVTPKSSTQID